MTPKLQFVFQRLMFITLLLTPVTARRCPVNKLRSFRGQVGSELGSLTRLPHSQVGMILDTISENVTIEMLGKSSKVALLPLS